MHQNPSWTTDLPFNRSPDASRLRNGTLWDDPKACQVMVSASKAAHKRLIDAVNQLNADLNKEGVLKKHLRWKLLILSLLIAYLEERGVFPQILMAKSVEHWYHPSAS